MIQEQLNTRFYIETYGCQMNEYDSLIAQNILEKSQARRVHTPEEAHLILLNTCAIRENAHEKIYNRLRSLEYLHKKGIKIGILGCMAQNLKEDLLYENLPIDFLMGPDALRYLPLQLIKKNIGSTKRAYLKLSKTETYSDLTPSIEHHLSSSKNSFSAFVSIQRGCDNFCSFCVVPHTRGRERSRSVDSIANETNYLVKNKFKSIVLLGQNVNSYRYDGFDFYGLIKELLLKTRIDRIYFTSPHPKDFPRKLIDLMSEEPRFCSQIHIPLQSGSNEVLKRMRRDYTQESFLDMIQYIKDRIPDIVLSTDVIVGFPDETESQFQETLKTMEEADFDFAFMFAYSERKGTSAKKLYQDNIFWKEKKWRLKLMIEEQQKRSLRKNMPYIDKEVEVLVEGRSKRNKNDYKGSLSNGKKAVFQSEQKFQRIIGNYIPIKINSVTSNTLLGSHIN